MLRLLACDTGVLAPEKAPCQGLVIASKCRKADPLLPSWYSTFAS